MRSYRVWTGKKMIYVKGDFYLHIADSGYWSLNKEIMYEDIIICDTLDNPEIVLMSSIGLCDAYGYEIYDGDVMGYAVDDKSLLSVQFTIEYNNGCYWSNWGDPSNYTIIGNKYEYKI